MMGGVCRCGKLRHRHDAYPNGGRSWNPQPCHAVRIQQIEMSLEMILGCNANGLFSFKAVVMVSSCRLTRRVYCTNNVPPCRPFLGMTLLIPGVHTVPL